MLHTWTQNIIKELKAIIPEAQKKNATKRIGQLLDDLAVHFIAQSFGAPLDSSVSSNLNNSLQDTNLSANVVLLLQVLVMSMLMETRVEHKIC